MESVDNKTLEAAQAAMDRTLLRIFGSTSLMQFLDQTNLMVDEKSGKMVGEMVFRQFPTEFIQSACNMIATPTAVYEFQRNGENYFGFKTDLMAGIADNLETDAKSGDEPPSDRPAY